MVSCLPLNADANSVIAYGVQVNMKPHVVMIVPECDEAGFRQVRWYVNKSTYF